MSATLVCVDRRLWLAFYRLIHSKGHNGRGDPATRSAAKRRYYQRHPEKSREYYQRNSERLKAQSAAWRKAHPARVRELQARWKQTPQGQRHALLQNLKLTTNAPDALVRACLANRKLKEELRHERF